MKAVLVDVERAESPLLDLSAAAAYLGIPIRDPTARRERSVFAHSPAESKSTSRRPDRSCSISRSGCCDRTKQAKPEVLISFEIQNGQRENHSSRPDGYRAG